MFSGAKEPPGIGSRGKIGGETRTVPSTHACVSGGCFPTRGATKPATPPMLHPRSLESDGPLSGDGPICRMELAIPAVWPDSTAAVRSQK
jgi:hypothetical protein